ncbi:MAG: hypothetical protein CMJ08_03260 [Pelagibacterales bacterium]|nr:hypothetical protein [Pelagibacterales bacterium]
MRFFFLPFILFFLSSCSGFTPLYQKHYILNEKLKNIAITTDKKKMSLAVKKNLLKQTPPTRNEINYIIKIETKTETGSSVTATDRKTSGYEVISTSNIFLYKRDLAYDKIIFSFEEKVVTMFELSPNQVLSTLASRDKAFEVSAKNLSKSILDKILIYFSKDNNANK